MIRSVKKEDSEALASIYNYYIVNTIVSFEEKTISAKDMWTRVEAHLESHPWIVFEEGGLVLGYAYSAPWKSRCAYRESAELSVYVDPAARGKKIGSKLYQYIIAQLKEMGMHNIQAGIALPNEASVALHEKLGFKQVADFKEVGYKFGKRIDVGYWQLMLKE